MHFKIIMLFSLKYMIVFMSNLNLYHLKRTLVICKAVFSWENKIQLLQKSIKRKFSLSFTSRLFFRKLYFSPSSFLIVLMFGHPALNTVLRY